MPTGGLGLGLAGGYGAAAAGAGFEESLRELIKQRLLEREQAEVERANREREAYNRALLGQRQQEFSAEQAQESLTNDASLYGMQAPGAALPQNLGQAFLRRNFPVDREMGGGVEARAPQPIAGPLTEVLLNSKLPPESGGIEDEPPVPGVPMGAQPLQGPIQPVSTRYAKPRTPEMMQAEAAEQRLLEGMGSEDPLIKNVSSLIRTTGVKPTVSAPRTWTEPSQVGFENQLDVTKVGQAERGLDLQGGRLTLDRERFAHQQNPPPNQKPLSPQQEISTTLRLAGYWDGFRKPIREMERQLTLMRVGYKEAAEHAHLNPGSQMILVTFQKVLDPPSVVRESEYARSPEGQAWLDRIDGLAQMIREGGPGVTIENLREFLDTSEAMYAAMATFNDGKRQQIERMADQWGLEKDLIFEAPAVPFAPDSPTDPAQPVEYDWDGNPVLR